MNCVDCGQYFVGNTGSFQCRVCLRDYSRYLKERVRDVETYDEPRMDFLLRKSKELGLSHNKARLKEMIELGMDDFKILGIKEYYTELEKRQGEMKWLLENTSLTMSEIAEMYNMTPGTVASLKNGTRYDEVIPLIPLLYKGQEYDQKNTV